MASPVSFCGARLFDSRWLGLDCDALAASPNHLGVPSVSVGDHWSQSSSWTFLPPFLCMRASCGSGGAASPALLSPRLLAPTLTGLPFAAEQMEVSNLL